MKRPVGVTILGILCLFSGGSGLLIPFDRPMIFLGMIRTGVYAWMLHLVSGVLSIYAGCGLLKPFRHVWYVYLAGAGIKVASLVCNVAHPSKIWELHLLLESHPEAIPQLVRFTIESQYLFIAVHLLTAIYIYLQKEYFWGNHHL